MQHFQSQLLACVVAEKVPYGNFLLVVPTYFNGPRPISTFP